MTTTMTCPHCDQEVEVTVTHDPGCYRTANGDGWPPSTEIDTAHNCGPWTEAQDHAFYEAACLAAQQAAEDDYGGPDADDQYGGDGPDD